MKNNTTTQGGNAATATVITPASVQTENKWVQRVAGITKENQVSFCLGALKGQDAILEQNYRLLKEYIKAIKERDAAIVRLECKIELLQEQRGDSFGSPRFDCGFN